MTHMPTLFLSHGSPMTALEPGELGRVWRTLAERLPRPRAIVIASAHWNTRIPMLAGAAKPRTVHDFSGFPPPLYDLDYPAPGVPELADQARALLTEAGLAAAIDPARGLDHGAWVPLRALYPDAEIPTLQLSIQPDRCARHHLSLGTALAPLRDQGVLIIGSGHMTHNLADYFRHQGRLADRTGRFRDWAHERLLDADIEALLNWQHGGAHAELAHPTPEHFLPLFVALGAAGEMPRTEALGGGVLGGALAADNYLFMPSAATAHTSPSTSRKPAWSGCGAAAGIATDSANTAPASRKGM